MRSCLIIGSGPHFLEETKEAKKLGRYDYVMAVKRALYQYSGKIDCFITLHPEPAREYIIKRYEAGYETGYQVYTCLKFPLSEEEKFKYGVNKVNVIEEGGWAGSSGLYAVRIATQFFSLDRVVLAGMPLNTEPRFEDNKPPGQRHRRTRPENHPRPARALRYRSRHRYQSPRPQRERGY